MLVAAIVETCGKLSTALNAAQTAQQFSMHKRLFEKQTELMQMATELMKEDYPENKPESQSNYDKETFYK